MEFNSTIRDDLLTKEELLDKFGILNYVIFVSMLLISALIGVFFWWKGQKNTEDFLLASRSMGTIPMTMSLVASFMSAITLLGVPAEIYTAGTQYVVGLLSYPFVMAAVAHFYLPVYDELRVTTSYEYLEMRFNKAVRMLTSLLFCIQMMLYMAIVVYAPALALIQVTGFLNGVQYDVELACAIIFIVCMFYTCMGGIKAVIWTDTFQALCMFGSFLAIIIVGSNAVGGASVVFDRNYQEGRVQLFNFDPDIRQRHTVWGVFFGSFFLWLSIYGTNQAQVQRYLTVKKKSQAVTALWLNAIGIGSLLLLCGYAGMVVYAFYYDCDPIKSKQVKSKDQIFPLFVMQLMGDYPGIPGLFVAGVFSGALSTVSSGLNSLAAVCLTDCLQLGCNIKISEEKKTLLTKLLALVFGLISFGIVFMVKYLPGVLMAAIGIFGMVGGPVLGAFSLGMFVPFANSIGAFTGMLFSLVFTFWWGFGQIISVQTMTYDSARFSPKMNTTVINCPQSWYVNDTIPVQTTNTEPSQFLHLGLYDVSYMWYGPVSTILCFLVGILCSFIRPQDHKQLDARLISPGCSIFFFWLPKKTRNKILNYYNEVGSEDVEDTNEHKNGAVFPKSGSINVAYIPSENTDM
eukprot:GFUD01013912.1.p1 GENE.GFUD01013912.1~~GFUD01013912.1.p1  ORF type:complete len:629 (+),score=119.06 GFUD01013912.1:145-2031(+)